MSVPVLITAQTIVGSTARGSTLAAPLWNRAEGITIRRTASTLRVRATALCHHAQA